MRACTWTWIVACPLCAHQAPTKLEQLSVSTDSLNDEVISVAGVDVRLAREPPLKRFLKTPRLKEDLAKCVHCCLDAGRLALRALTGARTGTWTPTERP